MRGLSTGRFAAALVFTGVLAAGSGNRVVRLVVEPSSVTLYAAGARQQFVVIALFADGQEQDVTREARFQIANAGFLREGDSPGTVQALSDGTAKVKIGYAGLTASAHVQVKNASAARKLSFTKDIAPILTMGGCTGSNCHGSFHGKADFKLSLFGYEPALDYDAITKASDGRRINHENPENSLILLKPTFSIPHGGGQRFQVGSLEYNALLEWIKHGTPYDTDKSPSLASLEAFPKERLFSGLNQNQQLVVRAIYSDGTSDDVTRKVQYTAIDGAVALVSRSGEVTSHGVGETTIMIRTLGQAVAARIAVVEQPPMREYPKLVTNNYIDELVFRKLKRLNIIPSELAGDADFLRRVYLDVAGIPPSQQEAETFLASKDPNKRQKLIDGLLERPEYADVWANRFNDLFRISNAKGGRRFQEFLLAFLRQNRPYDQFARTLLTGGGALYWDGPASFYNAALNNGGAENIAVQVSQTLLGVRVECARCHNHPFEKWTMDDFYGFASFFKALARKETYSDGEASVVINEKAVLKHPKTKQPVAPKLLDGSVLVESPEEDIRDRLADWITSRGNPWFARATVNRMWKAYVGRGLVEPVDDFRVTNPPSNPELLDALAKDFVDHQWDFKHIVRTILNSRVYQSSSASNPSNGRDTANYSHYAVRRLSAEQLADSIVEVTGVPERYPGNPPEDRAMMIPTGSPSYFLVTFGRKEERELICERNNAPDMAQAMHLISGDTIEKKINSPRGNLAKWLADRALGDDELTRIIYLRSLSREPDPAEQEKIQELFGSVMQGSDREKHRRLVFQDLMWALLTSSEFMFNH